MIDRHKRKSTYFKVTLLVCILATTAYSFAPSSHSLRPYASRESSIFAGIPTLDEWEPTQQGGVRGMVTNHPDRNILDGEWIATSPLRKRDSLQPGTVVVTQSGSQYKLGVAASKQTLLSRFSFGSNNPKPASTTTTSSSTSTTSTTTTTTTMEAVSTRDTALWNSLGLTGVTIGNGRYLLGSTPKKSTSGKSTLWPAYRNANPSAIQILSQQQQKQQKQQQQKQQQQQQQQTNNRDSIALWNKVQPTGKQLCVKISPYYDILLREDENYNRIMKKSIWKGRFVQKIDFLPSIQVYDSPNNNKKATTELNSNLCALVMEAGWIDLKSYLQQKNKSTSSSSSFFSSITGNQGTASGGGGLQRKALRDAAAAAAQCIQAIHGSNLVWTDLKTENFVLIREEDQKDMGQVKGIDLESAVSRGSPPTDFSPEACPPEFAAAFIAGKALDFQVDFSYDIWSYGMLLYELATGRCYFAQKSPTQITKFLAQLKGKQKWIDLGRVQDEKLRDLIQDCVSLDPTQRPGITQILLHPYFLTTGVGPYSF